MESLIDNVLQRNNWFGLQSLFYRNLLARIAVYYCFMLEGVYMGVWGRYLPSIQDSLSLSDSLLGTSVLFVYLGTVIVTPLVAILLRNFGSRITTTLGAWTFIISLPLIPLANSLGLLIFFMFNFGFCMGIMDVSMNNSAILTEIVAGKPLLGSFHGSYSVAAAIGSVLGGAFISIHLSTQTAFLLVGGSALFISCITCYNMYDQEQEKFLTNYHDEDRKELSKALLGEDAQMDYQSIEDDRNTMVGGYRTLSHVDPDNNDRGTTVAAVDRLVYANNANVANPLHDASTTANPNDSASGFRNTEFISADQLFSSSKLSYLEPKETDITAPTTDIEKGDSDQLNDQFSFEGLLKAKKIIFFFSAVGFLAAFGESGIVTWSVVYFERYIPSSSVIKSLGLTCFMVCMACGRFTCDFLRKYFGRQNIIMIGGLFALVGLIIVVLSIDFPAPAFFACLGFSITGLGLSTLIPIVFSSAGHLQGVHAGTALATVACFSYSGSIVSSPIIGLLSDIFGSLRYAMLFDAILLGMIFPLSWGIIAETSVFRSNDNK